MRSYIEKCYWASLFAGGAPTSLPESRAFSDLFGLPNRGRGNIFLPEVTKCNKSLPVVTSVAEHTFWSIISPTNRDFPFFGSMMITGRTIDQRQEFDLSRWHSKFERGIRQGKAACML